MKLSLKKYLSNALQWFVPFVLLEVLFLPMFLFDEMETGMYIFLAVVVNGILLLLAGYYFVNFLVFKKKCENYTPVEGVVSNWAASYIKNTASIIVNVDDREYSTSAYFSYEEAKNLVGKTISYAIIDETLFIYEIKE